MNQHFMKISWQLLLTLRRVRTAQEKPGKPQKRDFEKIMENLEKSGNFFIILQPQGKLGILFCQISLIK